MGRQICQQNDQKKQFCFANWREIFQILTISLLCLLLPLSFLLLARLSTAHYLLTFASSAQSLPSSSFIFTFFLYSDPAFLQILLSGVSVATLIQGLTGKMSFLSQSPEPIFRPRLYTAWLFLCTLNVFVGLGIEGSIAAGLDGSGFGHERSLLSRVLFFLGLNETMQLWSRAVVKPVVDDTIFSSEREARWVERVGVIAGFGTLWWWRLRDEIDSLVVVAEIKNELLLDLSLDDILGWWLYYLTVTIGMVRVVKGLLALGMIFLFRMGRAQTFSGDIQSNDDKV